MPRTPARVTYANVTSTLALVVALSAGGAYAANTIRSKDIVDGQVKAADLHKNSVSSAAIKDRAVTAADLAPGAVGSGALLEQSVRLDQLGPNAVDSSKILDNSVTSSDIANSAVGSFDIKDGGVQASDLADFAVTSEKIQDGQVETSDLAGSAVNSAKVLDNSLTMADIVGGDATVTATVSNLAAARCLQTSANVSGAVAGQVGLVSAVGAPAVGWGVAVLKVNDGAVVLNFCNLTGAVASITSQQFRVVTLG